MNPALVPWLPGIEPFEVFLSTGGMKVGYSRLCATIKLFGESALFSCWGVNQQESIYGLLLPRLWLLHSGLGNLYCLSAYNAVLAIIQS